MLVVVTMRAAVFHLTCAVVKPDGVYADGGRGGRVFPCRRIQACLHLSGLLLRPTGTFRMEVRNMTARHRIRAEGGWTNFCRCQSKRMSLDGQYNTC